jgi:nucleotide-binding universal stress UspA family protein
MARIRHILVATDFSQASRGAISLAADIACQLGAKVTLVHAYPPMIYAQHPGLVDRGDPGKETQLERERQLIDALEGLRASLLAEVPEVETRLVADERVSEALCNFAEQHAVDLMVIAPRGKSGLAHMLLGSVAEALSRHAPVPVLIARAKAT